MTAHTTMSPHLATATPASTSLLDTVLSYVTGRRWSLIGKYHDLDAVSRILNRELWAGQTKAQLIDSLGYPHRIAKMAGGELYSFDELGYGRFETNVILRNGLVSSCYFHSVNRNATKELMLKRSSFPLR